MSCILVKSQWHFSLQDIMDLEFRNAMCTPIPLHY